MFRSLIAAFIFVVTAQASAFDVTTKYGTLTGAEDGDAIVFKGVPYAAPPTGDLRWKAPREPATWSGAKSALAFGNQCPQASVANKSVLFGDEDCLYLNIFRPKTTAGKSPVMVFLHGGGNTLGSASDRVLGQTLYDGVDLSAHNVVVVTLNYRIGALGFLAHPELRGPDGLEGNYGLLDQIAALKYVRENIAAFGGDPSRVTLFGESAGAIDTLVLMTSPLAQGLFQRAIVESGFLSDKPLVQAEQDGVAFAKAAGCETNTAACLKSLSAFDLIRASQKLSDASIQAAGATIDGVVLKQSVLSAMKSGQAMKVPVIIGTNHDEMRTLLSGLVTLPPNFDDVQLHELLVKNYGADVATQIETVYPSNQYATATLRLEDILGDALTQCPTRQITRALLQESPDVYRYLFSHVSDNAMLAPYGAGHALELPYVFGNMSRMAYSSNEFELSESMQNWWTAFATLGRPEVRNQVQWTNAVGDSYLNLDESMMMNSRFHDSQCDFWDSITR